MNMPGECNVRKYIKVHFADDFVFSSEILTLALNAIGAN